MSRQSGQIDDFLAWHGGAGVQHLALSTDDIVTTVQTFAANGAGFAETPGAYYDDLTERLGDIDLPVDRLRPLGILVDRDHWGQMYQIFAKSMHIRRTFFWELIERHGAKTFGTSNIPALYAAKERELAGVRRVPRTRSDGNRRDDHRVHTGTVRPHRRGGGAAADRRRGAGVPGARLVPDRQAVQRRGGRRARRGHRPLLRAASAAGSCRSRPAKLASWKPSDGPVQRHNDYVHYESDAIAQDPAQAADRRGRRPAGAGRRRSGSSSRR